MLVVAASASSSAAPGALGFLVVFGMAVVLFFVFRSMSKHLRKVNDAARREEEAQAGAPAAQAGRGWKVGPAGAAPAVGSQDPGGPAEAAGPAGAGGDAQPAPRTRP